MNENQLARTDDVQPITLSEMKEQAALVIRSGLAPASFKTAEAVLVAMLRGKELHLAPMQSLDAIAVINGRPSLYGKALPAIVLRSGLLADWKETFEGEGDNLCAVCMVKRAGVETARTERYSVADAKKAGLWGKGGPWTQYPKDMLRYKARARAFTLFSDILCGMGVAEDLQDVPVRRVADAPEGDQVLAARPAEVIDPGPSPAADPQVATPNTAPADDIKPRGKPADAAVVDRMKRMKKELFAANKADALKSKTEWDEATERAGVAGKMAADLTMADLDRVAEELRKAGA